MFRTGTPSYGFRRLKTEYVPLHFFKIIAFTAFRLHDSAPYGYLHLHIDFNNQIFEYFYTKLKFLICMKLFIFIQVTWAEIISTQIVPV